MNTDSLVGALLIGSLIVPVRASATEPTTPAMPGIHGSHNGSGTDADPSSEDSAIYRHYRDTDGRDVYEPNHGTRVFLPRNVIEVPGPGWPSRAELQGQGYVFIERATGDSIRRLADREFELTRTLASGATERVRIELPGRASAEVTAVVTAAKSDRFTYSYKFRSSPTSRQSIYLVSVSLPRSDIITDRVNAHGWLLGEMIGPGVTLPDARATWLALGNTPMLEPDRSIDGLSITSSYFPGITTYFVRSAPTNTFDPPLTQGLNDATETFIGELARASQDAMGSTIGPTIAPPRPGERTAEDVARELANDVGRATLAGFLEESAARTVEGLILSASQPNGRDAALERLESIGGIQGEYRSAIRVALRALATEK